MLQGVLVRGHMRFSEESASSSLMEVAESRSPPRKTKTNEELVRMVQKLARYANKNGTTLDDLISAAANKAI